MYIFDVMAARIRENKDEGEKGWKNFSNEYLLVFASRYGIKLKNSREKIF